MRVRQLLDGDDQAGVARRNPKRVLSLRRGVLSYVVLHKVGAEMIEMNKERGGLYSERGSSREVLLSRLR